MTVDLMRHTEQQAVEVLRDEASQMARAAATAATQLVVSDESSAVTANEYLQKIDRGVRHLKARQAELTAPYRRIAEAIRDQLATVLDELSRGDRALRQSLAHYLSEQNRLAEVERRRQQDEADRAAQAQSSLGDDAPPPMEVPKPEVVKKIAGPSGSVHLKKDLVVEIVSIHDVPPGWLTLNESIAKAEWRAALARGDVLPSGQDWNGVRFSYKAGVARGG